MNTETDTRYDGHHMSFENSHSSGTCLNLVDIYLFKPFVIRFNRLAMCVCICFCVRLVIVNNSIPNVAFRELGTGNRL